MTPKEQEIAIGELEERVDRLRALYEQYFLGFEKLEPSVPRKDVDRRFAILRKQQIRNTALRFRFNVLTQKFNTYQMYWVRICRQIEEGTFKRHVRRANERFGKPRGGEAADISIDVDLADFELDDADMDSALAEANAAAAAYAETKHDTEPPTPRPAPPPARRATAITVQEDTLAELDALAAAAKAELPLRMAGPGAGSTSWVNMNRQRESLDEAPSSEPPRGAPPSDPHVRASLPAGAKPRILRKIGAESQQPQGGSRAPDAQPARIIRVGNPASAGGPSNSSGRLPAAAPAHSSGRLPAAPPASSSPIVAANARPPQGSQPQLPPMRAPQGSQPYVPPPARAPQGSQPLGPPAARPPQAPPNPQNLPPMRPAQGTQPNLPPMRPAQGTQPNLPPMRPPQGSQPNVPPMRPRTPSIVDGEGPVSRPRIQLPSQVTKAAPKKEGED